ncbi:hypothetical protein OUZ56_010428 [Daphnia magna]|uniref:Uncharacterized protein n=1 Tax=Daphnia magna TaxID=35525 RepID=A0ABR0AII3_9CRUS|nr:hypothetical protein OUZ56_010428 [Daphnia magna]
MKKFVGGAKWTVVERGYAGSEACLVEPQCSNLIAGVEDVRERQTELNIFLAEGVQDSRSGRMEDQVALEALLLLLGLLGPLKGVQPSQGHSQEASVRVFFSDSEWVVVTEISFGPIEESLNKLHLWFAKSAVAGGPRQAKRGIIDFGDTVLHWLFGIATNQDLERLNAQLQALGGETTGIVNAVAHQATLLNETLRELGEHVLAMLQRDKAHQSL